jgi:hypothetical protein
MGEKLKDPKLELGFLLDRNAEKAAALFSGKRVRTLAAVGLAENATDAQIVRKAWELSLTIVTVNGDDFVKEISKFQNQTKENDCHEVFGLVILPDGYENQKRLLQKAGSKLRLGTKKLTWWDVAHKNCCVRIKRSGNPNMRRYAAFWSVMGASKCITSRPVPVGSTWWNAGLPNSAAKPYGEAALPVYLT